MSVLSAWASRLVAEGESQRFSFDTYEREVERYGGPSAMRLAERLFAADSIAVLDMIEATTITDRVVPAVVSVDDMLMSLGLQSSSMRLSWLKMVVVPRREVADEYRAKRTDLITNIREPNWPSKKLTTSLLRRAQVCRGVISDLTSLEKSGELTLPPAKLYESYVHMHCNRLWAETAAERTVLGLLLRTHEAILRAP
jgi:thiopeptide-type bacteriocin biosynthesis protein